MDMLTIPPKALLQPEELPVRRIPPELRQTRTSSSIMVSIFHLHHRTFSLVRRQPITRRESYLSQQALDLAQAFADTRGVTRGEIGEG